MRSLILKLIFGLIILVSLSSCDWVKDLFNPKDNTPNNDINSFIKADAAVETNFQVAVYAIEDKDDPLYFYDYFDYPVNYGDLQFLNVDFNDDGFYHAYSTGSQDENFHVWDYDLRIYFSQERLYIDSMFLTNRVQELKFTTETTGGVTKYITRDLTFNYEIYTPIPIVTSDIDLIKTNSRLEYRAELTDEKDFQFKCTETYPEWPASYTMHYRDTKGTKRSLKVYVFFDVI